MTSQMDAIRITNLVKRYGQSLAVQDLTLSVPKGSMFGFLGPNGSGKAPPSAASPACSTPPPGRSKSWAARSARKAPI
jgi:ABC-2 type transport system ATP-binding protein